MKQYFLVILVVSLGGCKMQDAEEYSNTIMDKLSLIAEQEDSYDEFIDNSNLDSAKQKRLEILGSCDIIINDLDKLGPFKDDDRFLQAAIEEIKVTKDIYESIKNKEIKILSKIQNETDASKIELLEAELSNLNREKIMKAGASTEDFDDAFRNFALKNNI